MTALRLSRRNLIGSSLAAGALLPTVGLGHALAAPPHAGNPAMTGRFAKASGPTGWKTWHLKTPDELRPAKPADPTKAEIAELIGFQSKPTADQTAAITQWGTGSAVVPWSAMLSALVTELKLSGMRAHRVSAVLHTAMHDAVLASWDAQTAYGRLSPSATDKQIAAVKGVDPAGSSFPSAHAAIAGAAAAVYTAVFKDAAPGRFTDLAKQAGLSRLYAGAAFRSDMEAGLALGQAIGARAVARYAEDGAGAAFDPSTIPTGPGNWQPTPPKFAKVPIEPLGGTWKAWLLEKNDDHRPQQPPVFQSPAWTAELEMVQTAVANRTFEQESTAQWWQAGVAFQFLGWAHELIAKHGLDLPHASRVLAYVGVGSADTTIAVWDAKYTWWTVRPITVDPKIVTAFPTPNYPSYPSGFSAVSGSAAIVLGHFFPDAADDLLNRSWEAAKSRCWAGIHYMIDNETGLSMGCQVGRLVASAAKAEEAALSG